MKKCLKPYALAGYPQRGFRDIITVFGLDGIF